MSTPDWLASFRVQIGHHKCLSSVVAVSVEHVEYLLNIIDAQAAAIAAKLGSELTAVGADAKPADDATRCVAALLNDALAWGATYGPVLSADQWHSMRKKMVDKYCGKYAACASSAASGPDKPMAPVAWQFYENGRWWQGDDRIKNHRKNTEDAGLPTRDLYASPQSVAETKIGQLLAALIAVQESLRFANETPDGPIQDTLWMMHQPHTLFDYIDAAIAAAQKGGEA